MIVVDTNLLVGAVISGDQASLAVLDRDPAWTAPPLWRSEFLNVLAGYMRTQGLTARDASRAFDQAELLVEVEHAASPLDVLERVATSRCSAYDLEFVALAKSLGVPLVTNDRQVLEAFPGVAISPGAFAT